MMQQEVRKGIEAIDFIPQFGAVARQNHSIEIKDRHFWSEFCVYVLVIFTLVCLNGFVRFYPKTQTPTTQLQDASRFLFPHLNTCNTSSAMGKTSAPMRKTSALQIEGREDIQSFGFDAPIADAVNATIADAVNATIADAVERNLQQPQPAAPHCMLITAAEYQTPEQRYCMTLDEILHERDALYCIADSVNAAIADAVERNLQQPQPAEQQPQPSKAAAPHCSLFAP